MTDKISSDGLYPMAIDGGPIPSELRDAKYIKARWTGEFRCPRRGEWYLSGAIVEAYRAPSDLSQKFHIARLVEGHQPPVVWDE